LFGPPAGLGLIGAIGVHEHIDGKWHHAKNAPVDITEKNTEKSGEKGRVEDRLKLS
jgi:hypothetical protein